MAFEVSSDSASFVEIFLVLRYRKQMKMPQQVDHRPSTLKKQERPKHWIRNVRKL